MNILLISDVDGAESRLISENPGVDIVRTISPSSDFHPALSETNPDLLVVMVDQLPEFSFSKLSGIQDETPLPVVLLDDCQDDEVVATAAQNGVDAALPVDVGVSGLAHAACWAKAQFQLRQALKAEVLKNETKLADRIVIERAKGVLMKVKSLPEDTAYHQIRTMSMRRSMPMRAVAEQIINTAELVLEE